MDAASTYSPFCNLRRLALSLAGLSTLGGVDEFTGLHIFLSKGYGVRGRSVLWLSRFGGIIERPEECAFSASQVLVMVARMSK